MTEFQSTAPRVLLILPAFNEEGKIGRVIAKVPPQVVNEILVVDDCSHDGTGTEARLAGAKVVRHTHNRGVGAAIRTGIDYALSNAYAIVAVLSSDDQHNPAELHRLIHPIASGRCDFVQGSRRLGGLHCPNITWFRRCFTALYTHIFRALTGFPCTDATNGGRAFRTEIFHDKRINLWQDWLNTYELEPYLLYMALRTGVRVSEAPLTVIYHDRGTTKMKPVRDWWRILRPVLLVWLGLRK
jgi:dolichol-phosphate mannosyltransferase